MSNLIREVIDEMVLRVMEEITSKGVSSENAKEIELSILTVVMETQRAMLNELILIREKLESRTNADN